LYWFFMRKLTGSIPDEAIGFFIWPNPSSCAMALESTQPRIEMSTRKLPVGKGAACWRVRLTTSPPPVSRLSRKCGSLEVTHPMGFYGLFTGIALLNLTAICEPIV
jgi:hypothetical protein